ncbi:MAG: ribonuclease HI family protein [Candidatus Aquicultorales bacterium]
MGRKTKTIRIFSDGASRGNPGPAGAGAVIEDEEGNVLAEVSEYLGERTNNSAEYLALILALEKAGRFAECKVELRLDSQLLVEQLKGSYKVKSADLRPLYERSKELLSSFACIEIGHVYRRENALADELANKAIDEAQAGERAEKAPEVPEQESLF